MTEWHSGSIQWSSQSVLIHQWQQQEPCERLARFKLSHSRPCLLPFYCTKTLFQRFETLLQFLSLAPCCLTGFTFRALSQLCCGSAHCHLAGIKLPNTTADKPAPMAWDSNNAWKKTLVDNALFFQNSLNLHWQIKQRFWLGTLPSHKVHAGFRLSTRRVTRNSMSWN